MDTSNLLDRPSLVILIDCWAISLSDKQVIGVKNLYKHTDIFAPLVQEQYYVATPGVCQPDFSLLEYKKLPRPIWPLDGEPLKFHEFWGNGIDHVRQG